MKHRLFYFNSTLQLLNSVFCEKQSILSKKNYIKKGKVVLSFQTFSIGSINPKNAR